ncbi:uncharacterized protein LOC131687858 [Topomyia yanbarensis]|uniref:uncharacterized protein LOC131687858 n=1 Tax=Topomyia yanbarensis TaxID=2498891 RepID=UPI00273A870D|nr:uncharacterized protein LOC131687858 [Topomyia yanbarensis]
MEIIIGGGKCAERSCLVFANIPVTNPNKPTKLRIVWDAAAKAHGVSLNTFLLKGPDQLTSLPGVLHRFRKYRIAVSGDICEMFHQVQINNDDQHCQRFLWKSGPQDQTPSVYVMTVMTFGATCSLSCAQYVKNKNAERFVHKMPAAVDAIINEHNVDDMLSSVETEKEAVDLATNVRFIHAQAGFEIRGWLSNSNEVLAALNGPQTSEKDLNVNSQMATEKILGLWWNTKTDTFTFRFPKRADVKFLSGQTIPTKREVLRVLMSIFDPLGFLANVLMYLKVLLQEIWRAGTAWDEPIANEQFVKWRTWLGVLTKVDTVSIPRCYRVKTSSMESNKLQLHIFVDASENGFAAVGYFRYEEQGVTECAFVAAKTRVAPLKYVSIPRLELQAAVIGARLAKTIVERHRVTINERFFWTDSRDVLCWLNSDHRRYSQFVAFRIGEILENTDVSEWHWLSTQMNVADEGTKWQKLPDLSPSSRWFRGLSFIWMHKHEWPDLRGHVGSTSVELRHSVNLHQHEAVLVNFSDFSNWKRLLRLVALVFRFAHNLKAKLNATSPTVKALRTEELQIAESYIFRQVQLAAYSEEMAIVAKSAETSRFKLPSNSTICGLSLYLDDRGLLRIRGRETTLLLHLSYARYTIDITTLTMRLS